MKKIAILFAAVLSLAGCAAQHNIFTVCTADQSFCFDSAELQEDKDRLCVSSNDSRVCGAYTIHRNFIPSSPASSSASSAPAAK